MKGRERQKLEEIRRGRQRERGRSYMRQTVVRREKEQMEKQDRRQKCD